MCKGMNRSFFNVILGGFGATDQSTGGKVKEQTVKSGNADDAAFLMKTSSVIIVPGYGMAVAQAQHFKRNGRYIKKERYQGFLCFTRSWKNAWSYECFVG